MEKEITIKIPECLVDFIKSMAAKFDSALRWRDKEDAWMKGWWIDGAAEICIAASVSNTPRYHNVFATEKQAKSALAMARISQIMANDKRFGGAIGEDEWNHGTTKYTIISCANRVVKRTNTLEYSFLAFHASEERDLFMEENMDLIKDYFMLE